MRCLRLLRPAPLRAALWAWRAHNRLRGDRVAPVVTQPPDLPPPPRVADGARDGAQAALALLGATCLRQAVVLQRWDAAHGRPRDLVIGVTAPGGRAPGEEGFRAHAWLDGDDPCHAAGFAELTRVAALR